MPEPTDHIDPALKDWATDTQARYVDAVNEHGSIRAAARQLGVSYYSAYSQIERLKAKAAVKGYSPEHGMTRTVPEPFVVRGVSTYYNKDGKAAGQWVKSRLDDS